MIDIRSSVGSSVKLPRSLLWGRLSPLGLALAAFSLFADQLFKFWMLHVVDVASKQPIVVTPFFNLVLAWNQGVSYGWFAQSGDLGWLILTAVSLVASIFLWI